MRLRSAAAWFVFVAACVGCSRTSASSVHRVETIRDLPIAFRSGDAMLAGTLFVPDDGVRHPAIVLFHGSGPEPRNAFMARWFAEHGVAALTYDKRGVGASTGDFHSVSFTALAADGLAAVALLKARSDVDPARIGIWGLSQGGWLGPLAASRSADVAFVIAVSGPGVTPAEQMIFYYANQLRERGFGDDDVERASDLRRKVWHLLSTGDGDEAARDALDRARGTRWLDALADQNDGLFGRPPSEILHSAALRERIWFREEANYDPTVALRALSVPALFVFGADDALVPVERSVSIIRTTLTAAGRRDFEIVVFPGADHGIRVSSADGRRTLAPGYLDTVEKWLSRTLDGSRSRE
jgi:dienelactone hydrolase